MKTNRRRMFLLRLQAALIAAFIIVGTCIFVYPATADWFSSINHTGVLRVYEHTVNGKTAKDREQALSEARAYNASLGRNTLEDPFTNDGKGRDKVPTSEAKRYLSLLNPGDDGVMAEISIPTIGVDLPIYHGTAEQTLANGIGHLYGTALPVGGSGTHAVLTGHSGYAQSKLFTDVDKLNKGDTFDIHVEGQTLRYQVDQITTVLPDDLSALQTVPGKDYVSLVTCTPIGVNSHRLLVRGVRVPSSPAANTQQPSLSANTGVAFPWWALALLVALAVGWWIVANCEPPVARKHIRVYHAHTREREYA